MRHLVALVHTLPRLPAVPRALAPANVASTEQEPLNGALSVLLLQVPFVN